MSIAHWIAWSQHQSELQGKRVKGKQMPKTDEEQKILTAYEKGRLKSIATKAELAKFKAAARATKPATGPARKRRATSGS